MQVNLTLTALLMAVLLTTGCSTVPTGPSTMAMPGTGKSFDQFREDDASCRQFAQAQIGGTTASQAANESMARSAAAGTVVGAAVGAAAGGGEGAGVGAATGLLVGATVGANEASVSSYGAQRRYDIAYIQCMYAKGHRVPVSGRYTPEQRPAYYPPPPPPPPDYRPPVPRDAPR